MRFKRKIGWEFDWYAVDKLDSIGLFASGFAAVPKIVFEDESKYLNVLNFFENLPTLTNAHLSALYENKKHKSLNGFANQILEAERGIYTFYDEYYTDVYELAAIPDYNIKISNLPGEIQDFLYSFVFEDIVFAETESINIKRFFDCE